MKWVRWSHKWLSIVVGLQLLIWLVSGFYFNLMDHEKVGGNQYRQTPIQQSSINYTQLLEAKHILAQAEPAISIELIHLLGRPYYLLNHHKGLYPHFKNRYSLYDAYQGELTELSEEMVKALALQTYNGSGKVASVKLLTGPIDDFAKQKNATWQVNFDNQVNTSVYVEAGSGRIVGHSDDDKRFADFFFMLHFMDYGGQGSFNNPQMMFFAFFTFWLSLTGFIWTVHLAKRGHYKRL